MEKVIQTTYRKLVKMCSRADQCMAIRSMLSCAPGQVYHHRIHEWVQLDVAKLSSWQESRIFLNNLIRRLNNGRQFYIPPVAQAAEAAVAAGAHGNEKGGAAEERSLVFSAHASVSAPLNANTEGSPCTDRPIETGTSISVDVKPYAALRPTLRYFFENTPFSVSHLNNAFAAVKELSYVCKMADQYQSLIVGVPAALQQVDRPPVKSVLKLEPMHQFEIPGSAEGLPDSHSGSGFCFARRSFSKASWAKKAQGASTTPCGEGGEAGGAQPKNAFDDPVAAEGAEAAGQPGEVTPSPASPASGEPISPAGGEGTCIDKAAVLSMVVTMPEKVQLLLAHPQLFGFFRHSVMLVVRHSDDDSIAFIINNPLENDQGLRMPVGATIRLNRVHPIFGKFLRDHTVMVGGPVMTGAFDDNLFLLHTVPGVPMALPLAENLWLDGDLDVLMAKLSSGEASPDKVVVLCGLAGWGHHQLAGEMEEGSWVGVSAPSSDGRTSKFIMAITEESGAHASLLDMDAAPPLSEYAAPRDADVDEEQTESTSVNPNPLQIHTRRRTIGSWVWVYDALDPPLRNMAMNQKPESVEASE